MVNKDNEAAFVGVGDFPVDGRFSFEVGEKGKRFTRIADVSDSYVVNDDAENNSGDFNKMHPEARS